MQASTNIPIDKVSFSFVHSTKQIFKGHKNAQRVTWWITRWKITLNTIIMTIFLINLAIVLVTYFVTN